MKTTLTRQDIAFLFCAIAAFLFFFREWPVPAPFSYDEADYMAAASSGIWNNVTETPSISFAQFVKLGLEQGKDPSKRSGLSQLIRSTRDITFSRHYHGPFYFYYLAALTPLFHGSEKAARASSLAFHVLAFAAIFLGTILLTGSRIAGCIASFLLLFSSAALGTATAITPHAAYVCAATLTLLAFAAFLRTLQPRWWYTSVLFFVIAMCNIEYSVVLPIMFALCIWRTPGAWTVVKPRLFRSIAVALAALIVIWPASLLKLSILKTGLFFAQIILRKGDVYGGNTTFLEAWSNRMALSPCEYAIDILCLILAVVLYRRVRARWLVLPCLVYTGFLFLATMKNTSLAPAYTASIMPALAMVSGVVISELLEKIPARAAGAVAIAIMIVLTADGFRQLRVRMEINREALNPDSPEGGTRHLLDAVRQTGLDHDSGLVPIDLMPTLSYYFPSMKLTSYSPADSAQVVASRLSEGHMFVYVDRNHDPLPAVLAAALYSPRSIGQLPSGLGNATIYRTAAN